MTKLDLTGLGDLAASISPSIGAQRASFQMIPLECIRASTTNPRKRFDQVKLDELAESIRQLGVAQPILVRPVAHDIIDQSPERFEIVAGERRYRASGLAGMQTVPAIVRDLTNAEALEIQVIENLQRADLHPLEEAEGYEALMKAESYTAEVLAVKVSKSKAYIYARLKLCALVPEARELFYAGELTASTAILIARIPVKSLQVKAAKEITSTYGGPMSTRAAQNHIERIYMLRLKDAIFKTKDDALLAAAGACTSCPKLTGNQPELFADVDAADVCTDPQCFDAKGHAHIIRIKLAASEKGQTVFSGIEAKKIMPSPWNDLTSGYINLDKEIHHGGKQTTYRKILAKDAPVGALLENPHAPGMIEIVKAASIEVMLEEKGIVLNNSSRASIANSAAKAHEKEQESAAAIEKDFRRRLFIEIDAASPPALDTQTRIDVATMLFSQCPDSQKLFILGMYGWDKSILEYPDRKTKLPEAISWLTGDQLNKLIRNLTLVSDLHVYTYTGPGNTETPPNKLLEMALCVGIHSKRIRDEVEAEAQAKVLAKKRGLPDRANLSPQQKQRKASLDAEDAATAERKAKLMAARSKA